jgi:hypothetical protein
MFSTFLLGTLLITSLVMLVLLVSPRPGDDVRITRLPFVGIVLFLILAILALVTGVVATL